VTNIIKPERRRRYPDPYITPVSGARGPCALCRTYADLTEDHIPPESLGNGGRWVARSYLTTASADKELIFGREFRSGIRFRTLCKECNNGLGGREDKALADFFERVSKLINSPLILNNVMRVTAKPNLIYRAILAHIIAANDQGIPTAFDTEGRNVFFRKQSLGLSSWSLFYWIYTGPSIFVMRNAYYTVWRPLEIIPIQVLKCFPLAFMFAQKPWFSGLPNLLRFARPRDDEEIELPILMNARENLDTWPAVPIGNTSVILAGDSFGYVGSKN
jgi:hypothetical protein